MFNPASQDNIQINLKVPYMKRLAKAEGEHVP
jgi:hypothetical protein